MPSSRLLPTLFLASQSPRRKQILESLCLPFQVVHASVEEIEPSEEVEKGILHNARIKAEKAFASLKDDNAVVIGADTLVVLDGKTLGKPSSPQDVHQMLGKLSGRSHEVITGLVLLSHRYGNREVCEKSVVTFKPLSEGLISEYAAIKEPYDKAGSYAVQGFGAVFIDRIEGSYTNVMGFPMERFLDELSKLVPEPLSSWFPR